MEVLICLIVYLKSIVGPASELHITILIIEWEPSNVNLTSRFENSRRNVSTTSCICHHDIGWECSIELLIGTEIFELTKATNKGIS